jgi:hypothetical protein
MQGDSNMKHLASLTALAVAGTFGAAFLQADQWDKKTIITINQPMQMPAVTLQPGTYVLKLLPSDAQRHVVQVFNKDQTRLITTMFAIPNERVRPTGKSVFAFWETPAGQPQALRAWFYPGDNFGQEFMYPKREADVIAKTTKETVPTTEETPAAAPSESASSMPVATSNNRDLDRDRDRNRDRAVAQTPVAPVRAPAPVEIAQVTPRNNNGVLAAPEPQAAPAPQSTAPASSLPQTASNLPLLGLMGLLSLLGFAGIGLVLNTQK